MEKETLYIAEKLAYRPHFVFMVLLFFLCLVGPTPTLRK